MLISLIQKILTVAAIFFAITMVPNVAWADGQQCGDAGQPPCEPLCEDGSPQPCVPELVEITCSASCDAFYEPVVIYDYADDYWWLLDPTPPADPNDDQCGNASVTSNAATRVGYATAQSIGTSTNGTKAACQQDWVTCVEKCNDYMGVNWTLNIVTGAAGVGGVVVQQRIDRWTLGTLRELSRLRACAAVGTFIGGVSAAYTGGATVGCMAACAGNPCHVQ